jgi:MoxR-like ATPase
VQYGASPRAAIAVAEAARGIALLARRPTVGFEDVRQVVIAALNHRILLNYKAKFAGVDSAEVLQDLLKSIKETDLGLDQEIEIAATGS